MTTAAPRSRVTLRALEGEPLAHTAIREMVEATAHAIAERQGVALLELDSTPSSITATLEVERLAAMGFAAELRRLTTSWYRHKFGVPDLWGRVAGEHDVTAAALPHDVGRVLVVCPSWVGDTVMATGALRALRERRPSARITALVRPGLEPLLAGAPWIDEITAASLRGLLGPWRAARSLPRGFDAVLLLPNSFRSALAARLARIPIRIGTDRDGRRRLLTHPIPWPARAAAPRSAVDLYASIAEAALGGPPIDRGVRLVVTDAERAGAATLLAEDDAPLVVLHPGANRSDKRWPAERFAAVADTLAARGARVVVTGAPAERDVAAAVVRGAASRPTDLAATGVDLGVLKGVLARAALLVTNDTGPRHIAAALGTPTVVLFGPTDHRWTTLPGVREVRLLAEPFLPETLVADHHAGACAIDRIRTDDVIEAAAGLLAGRGGRPGAAPRE